MRNDRPAIPPKGRPRDIHATDNTVFIRKETLHDRACENDDTVGLGRPAQTVDQFAAGPARQAMHAHRRMAGIVEIIDHTERKCVMIGQPFHQRGGLARSTPRTTPFSSAKRRSTTARVRMMIPLASAAPRKRSISSRPVLLGKPCMRIAEWPG